ncbi:MAG: ATP-grasp domain-containing protein [Clostridiaceae bacterium]|nr:ATP-grasp domain-containing protein [Clostridiaceae bacterium]
MRLHGWIIYSRTEAERNQAYIEKYVRSAERLHVTLNLIYAEEIECGFDNHHPMVSYEGRAAVLPDFAINRTGDPFLAHHLEAMDLPVFNRAIVSEICLDKRRSMQLASAAGLPVMPSVFCSTAGNWPDYYSLPWQGPTVIKPVDGRGGRGVQLVRDENEYLAALGSYEHIGKPPVNELIIQQAASDLGRDLRVYVIGSHIEAAMLRRSDPERDFRSNYCLGGEAIVHELNHCEKVFIKQLINRIDVGLVGIDLIYDNGQPIFNEIEDVVGSRMLYSMNDLDIADRYLEHIVKAVRRGF